MSEPEEQSGGEVYDAPNQQAVGLDPPWVEGAGGGGKQPSRRPSARRPQPKAASRAEPSTPSAGSAPANQDDDQG